MNDDHGPDDRPDSLTPTRPETFTRETDGAVRAKGGLVCPTAGRGAPERPTATDRAHLPADRFARLALSRGFLSCFVAGARWALLILVGGGDRGAAALESGADGSTGNWLDALKSWAGQLIGAGAGVFWRGRRAGGCRRPIPGRQRAQGHRRRKKKSHWPSGSGAWALEVESGNGDGRGTAGSARRSGARRSILGLRPEQLAQTCVKLFRQTACSITSPGVTAGV